MFHLRADLFGSCAACFDTKSCHIPLCGTLILGHIRPEAFEEMRELLPNAREMIVGQPVLLVIDVQMGCFLPSDGESRLTFLPDSRERMLRVRSVIDSARNANVPVIFFQEAHRPNMVDFGRELDGAESVHCVEGDAGTPIAAKEMGLRDDDYVIRKRRYSCFFGTELEILLKGLRAETLILTGGFTDVCVHYTFVDGHQHDYFCRVIEDCVTGSGQRAHDGALEAMEYLQSGARRTSAEIMQGFVEHGRLNPVHAPTGRTDNSHQRST